MKDTLMMMVGAVTGIGIYIGLTTIAKNKNAIKKTVNTLIDETANIVNN